MNYHMQSELSTILYNIEQQNAKLDLFLANNRQQLVNLELYDKIAVGHNLINNGTHLISEIF